MTTIMGWHERTPEDGNMAFYKELRNLLRNYGEQTGNQKVHGKKFRRWACLQEGMTP